MNNHSLTKGCVFMKLLRKGHPQLLLHPETDRKTAENETSTISKLDLFDENFDLKFKLNVGDVYLARFPKTVGSELEGEHFVVAVMNSGDSNPNAVVVPLTSLKEKMRNPSHSVYLGFIKGIDNGKESVALLNQVISIDKKRLLSDTNIDKLIEESESKHFDENQFVVKIHKPHYRLTNTQLNKLLLKAELYFKRNSRKNWVHKLVDF